MKKLMTAVIGLLLLSTALAASDVLVVEFTIDKNDTVTLSDVRLLEGTETIAEGTDYSIVLLSAADEVLQTTYFDVTFTAYGLDNYPTLPDGEGVGIAIDLNETELIVRIPYNTQASKFEIRKGTTALLEQEINLCDSDGACEPANGENYLSCLADCPSGSDDDYCDTIFDDVCDPDCGQQGRQDKDTDCTCGDGTCDVREDSITCSQDCGAASNDITNLIMMVVGGGIGIIVLIVVIIVVLIKRRKGKK